MPPNGAKAGTPAVAKPAEAEGSEGPDAYPPPARVSVGASPVYIPEKKLGKGGFGQVQPSSHAAAACPLISDLTTPLLLTFFILLGLAGKEGDAGHWTTDLDDSNHAHPRRCRSH